MCKIEIQKNNIWRITNLLIIVFISSLTLLNCTAQSKDNLKEAFKKQSNSKKNSAPNILLILVDDVGYADIGAFSARINKTTTDKLYYETPEIDKLAKQGTMFTQFYACTVCAPTRASLMTGKMNNRMGMWDAYAAVKTTYEKSGKSVPDDCHILDNEPWDEYNYSKTDRGVSIPVAATSLHNVKNDTARFKRISFGLYW